MTEWIRETRPNGARNLWARSHAWYVISAGLTTRPSGPEFVWFGAVGWDRSCHVADMALSESTRLAALPEVTRDDLVWLRMPVDLNSLSTGSVLLWEGKPAVRRTATGWRYLQLDGSDGRDLGENEVAELSKKPYAIRSPQ